MKVNIYTSVPSHYQADVFRAFSKYATISVVYEHDLGSDRTSLGWKSDLENYQFEFENHISLLKRFRLKQNDYHLLSGMPGSINNIVRVLLPGNNNCIIAQTELPPLEQNTFLWKHSAKIYSRQVVNNGGGILAIGRSAYDFFLKCGIREKYLFPFGYFPHVPSSHTTTFDSPIVYVGQLNHRKNVSLLIKAYSRSIHAKKRDLVIIGTGPDANDLKELSKKECVQDTVRFVGAVPSGEIIRFISKSSLLVLPSRYDGWGVVINEALGSGVPVISSDACGASELVDYSLAGRVFPSENLSSLTNSLDYIFSSRPVWEKMSKNATKYYETITPDSAVRYLLSIYQYIKTNTGEKPTPPWHLHNSL